MIDQFALIALAQAGEHILFCKLLHVLFLQPYADQIIIQCLHHRQAAFHQTAPDILVFDLSEFRSLQHHDQRHLFAIDALRQRFSFLAFKTVRLLPEEFEISAIVKNQETPLAQILSIDLIRAEQLRCQAGTTADHLPELRFGPYLLEKYQVHTLRYIDTGIHHIHRYHNVRCRIRFLKIADDRPRVGIITDHTLAEFSIIHIRVQFSKALYDELRMPLVLRKDDRFTQPVTAVRFDPTLHQILQYQIHGLLIKNKIIQCCRRNKVRNETVLYKIILVAFLIRLGQIIVGDAFVQKLGLHFIVVIWYQHMILIYCSLIIVRIGRYTVLYLKEIIGIMIHLHLWRSRQPHQHRIKVFKDRAILLKDRPVCLIQDDQIKVCRRIQRKSILRPYGIDGIQHGRIGRKYNTCIPVIFPGA